MIKRLQATALLLTVVFLSGCFFDQPLTSTPNKDINTWLLGVWEQKDPGGDLLRTTITPLTGSRYTVFFQETKKGSTKHKSWQFEGWISRVGEASFLILRCDQTSGDVPVGSYLIVHYTVAQPNLLYTRLVQLEVDSSATSLQQRQEVRRRLKDHTLLAAPPAAWTRVSEVYWDPANPPEQPFQRLRFPTAPVVK